MQIWKTKPEHFEEAKTAQRAMPIFLTMLLAAAIFIGIKYLLTFLTDQLYQYVQMQVALLRIDPEAPIFQDIALILRASGLGVLLIPAFLYVRFLEGRRLSSAGLRQSGAGKALLIGLLTGTLLFAAVLAVLLFLNKITFEGEVMTSLGVRILCVLSVILGGFSFEFYFRGFVLSSLGARCRTLVAVLLTAILSAAAHAYYWGFSYHSVANALLLDFILGLLTVRTGHVLTSCAARTAYLLICQFVFGAVHSGNAFLHALVPAKLEYGGAWVGSANGLDGGTAMTVILAAVLLLLLLLPKRGPRKEEAPRPFMEHVPTDRESGTPKPSAPAPAEKKEEKPSVLRRPESLKKQEPQENAEEAPSPDAPDETADPDDDEEWEAEETRVHVEPNYKKPEDYLK